MSTPALLVMCVPNAAVTRRPPARRSGPPGYRLLLVFRHLWSKSIEIKIQFCTKCAQASHDVFIEVKAAKLAIATPALINDIHMNFANRFKRCNRFRSRLYAIQHSIEFLLDRPRNLGLRFIKP